MVQTRRQAADGCQANPNQNISTSDLSPESNLNLLASSASSEALLSAAIRRKIPESNHGDAANPSGPLGTTPPQSDLGGSARPVCAEESSPSRSTEVSSSLSVTELNGSALITSESTANPAPVDVASCSSTSSSSQMIVGAAQGTASSLLSFTTAGAGEKVAGPKQFKIVYRLPQPQTSSAVPRLPVVGVGHTLAPESTQGQSSPQCVVLPSDGGPTYHILLPISTTAPTQLPPGSSLMSPRALGTSLLSPSALGTNVPGSSLMGTSAPGSILMSSSVSGSSQMGSGAPGPILMGSSAPGSILMGSSVSGSSQMGSGAPGTSLLGFSSTSKSPTASASARVIAVSPPTSTITGSATVESTTDTASISFVDVPLGSTSGYTSTATSPPPLSPAVVTSTLKALSVLNAAGMYTTPPPLHPVVMTSSVKPDISHDAVSTGSKLSLGGHCAGSSANQSVVTSGTVTEPLTSNATSAISQSLTGSGPVSVNSVSHTLFQLAHTAHADLKGHTSTSSKTDLVHTNSVTGDVNGQGRVISTQVPSGSFDAGTTGVLIAPRPPYSMLSVPLQSSVPALPLQVPASTSLLSTAQPPMLPVASKAEGGAGSSQTGEGETVTWDRNCTLKLIQLYKEHQMYLTDHHYKKKSVWELIASKLRQSVPEGPPFRWNHVENKWKNMTKKFRDCINHNRRSFIPTKCNYFEELAAVYNYNPQEEHRKAAVGLQALKSGTQGQSTVGSDSHLGERLVPTTGTRTADSATKVVMTKGEKDGHKTDIPGSVDSSSTHAEGVPLLKKKKYAHLGHSSHHTPLVPPHPPGSQPPACAGKGEEQRVKKEGAMDIAGLLQQLREDRARLEVSRMERLEQMHREKMAMFGRFLDVLQTCKPSGS